MCKCREKNKAKGSLGALSLALMEMAMADPIEFVELGLNDSAPLGGKVYIPARIDKALRGEKVPNYKLRVLTINSRNQSVPSILRDWMREDYRYRAWFDAAPVVVDSLEILEGTDDEDTIGGNVIVPNESETPSESIFDLWMREDIEDANLTGEEGLLAYAAHNLIDLGDASLKAEVLEAILEWYDANVD